MFQILFNEAKATEAIAYFLGRSGGEMEILKLMKLAYLAERKSYELYGEPMMGDAPYSFEHGPVLSTVFDLAKVNSPKDSLVWNSLVAPSADKYVHLKNPQSFNTDDLLNLSDADIQVLDAVWSQFGHMTASELRDYTHQHLPEYREQEPGRRAQIDRIHLLKAVGFEEQHARKYVRDLQASARVKVAFGAEV